MHVNSHSVQCRQKFIKTEKYIIEDQIFRSYSLLKSARIISYKETKDAILWLRVAVFYGILDIDLYTLNKMFIFLKKAHLKYTNEINVLSHNEARAYYARKYLNT